MIGMSKPTRAILAWTFTVVLCCVVRADDTLQSTSTFQISKDTEGIGRSVSIRFPLSFVPLTTCYPEVATDVLVVPCQYEGLFTFGSGNPVSLLVDPGSGLVAVGKEFVQDGLTNVSEDSSYCRDIFSQGYGDTTEQGASQECKFAASYQSGESIDGIMVTGPLVLTGTVLRDDSMSKEATASTSTSEVEDVSTLFGIVESDQGGIGATVKDGIVGVDRTNISLTTQLYAADLISVQAFGQCGTNRGENDSFGIFGPYVPPGSYQRTKLYTGEEMGALGGSLGDAFAKAAKNIQDDIAGYYSVFSGVEVDGKRVENASYDNLPILFDTGTPSLILPKEYASGIVSYIKDRASAYGYEVIESTLPDIGDQILVFPKSGDLDPTIIPEIFPNITVILGEGEVKVTLPPEAYVASGQYQGQSGFIWIISVLGSAETLSTEGGLILGIPFIYERFVQVDVSNSTMLVSDATPGCVFSEVNLSDSSTGSVPLGSSGSVAPMQTIILMMCMFLLIHR